MSDDWHREQDRISEDRARSRKAIRDSSNKAIRHITRGEHTAAIREMGMSLEYAELTAGTTQPQTGTPGGQVVREVEARADRLLEYIVTTVPEVYPEETLTPDDLQLLRAMAENQMLEPINRPMSDYPDAMQWWEQMGDIDGRIVHNTISLTVHTQRVEELGYLLGE